MAAALKKRLWQVHSWLGLIAGLGLLIIGLTGSLLVFHEEIDVARVPQLMRAEPTAAGRLPFDTLLAAVEKAKPGETAVGWRLFSEPHQADLLFVKRAGEKDLYRLAFLDPYTGEVRGDSPLISQTLTGWLLDLHYSFLADHTGMFIAGIFALLLCVLGVTGVWLYRDFWRAFFTLRWGRSLRIFCSDLHKMIGISSVAFNLILGFTGAYWNLTHVIGEWIMGEPPEPTVEVAAARPSLDASLAVAQKELPGFQVNYLTLPASGDFTLYGRVDTNPFRGNFGSTVSFNLPAGTLKEVKDIRKAGAWEQFADSFAPLHYGTFGGVITKSLWCLFGLAPGVLAVSGFLIWRSRHKAARRESSPAPEPATVP